MLEGNTFLWSITTVNNFRHDVSRLKYLLQPQNVHALCSSPVVLATQTCTELVQPAESVCDRFERCMLLLGRCHDIYNSARPITEAEANNLGT